MGLTPEAKALYTHLLSTMDNHTAQGYETPVPIGWQISSGEAFKELRGKRLIFPKPAPLDIADIAFHGFQSYSHLLYPSGICKGMPKEKRRCLSGGWQWF